MTGKNINFDNKNIKKGDFHNKNKQIFNISDIDINKILFSKKSNVVSRIRLNKLLGIMILMLLDHYIYLFHKPLGTLMNLIKIK